MSHGRHSRPYTNCAPVRPAAPAASAELGVGLPRPCRTSNVHLTTSCRLYSTIGPNFRPRRTPRMARLPASHVTASPPADSPLPPTTDAPAEPPPVPPPSHRFTETAARVLGQFDVALGLLVVVLAFLIASF